MTRSHAFSRALRQPHVITSSFDWFNVLSVCYVIGQSNYFGFGFTTLKRKPLYCTSESTSGQDEVNLSAGSSCPLGISHVGSSIKNSHLPGMFYPGYQRFPACVRGNALVSARAEPMSGEAWVILKT